MARAGRHARRCHHGGAAAGAGRGAVRAVSRHPRPTPEGGARAARPAAALLAPGRGVSARRRRRAHRRHHAHRFRQDALLQPAGARRDPERPVVARAVSVPDQGARAGPDGGTARAHRARQRAGRARHRRAHLRRRHAGRCPQDHSRPRPHRAHQSRHAARGCAAASSAVGEAVRESEVRGDRRAACLSRRVRQPLVQRAAAAAAHLRALRLASAVHLFVSHHRQPARAGGAAGRTSVLAHRAEWRPTRREVHRVREPAGGESRTGHPPVVPGRSAARRGRVPAPQLAGDRVRAEPARHRDSHHLSERGLRDRAGHGRADSRLPRRLPAAAPARDREGPARRQGARRGLDQRARARYRHRRARRVDHGRLSGHHRLHVAAGRPRRPPGRAFGRRAGRVERAHRPVRSQAPGLLLRRLARARAGQSRQPAHPGRPREVRRLRAAVPWYRHLWRGGRAGGAADPARERPGAPLRGSRQRRAWAVELDERELSGRRGELAVDHVRQLRDRRRRRRRQGDRRDRLHERADHAAPEGHLHRRRPPLSGRGARLRQPQGLRARRRLRLLHDGDLVLEGDRAGCGPGARPGGRARRRARVVARRRVQEDQVLHQRERRFGGAGLARAADAHHRLLAVGTAGRDGVAALVEGRQARRRGRPGLRHEARGHAAADV